MKILLVEDEPSIARAIIKGLEREQFEVDHCSDGKMGLEMALSHQYNLIILDIMLPEMDGCQVCEMIRGHSRRDPILMLSARSEIGDRVRGLDIGADDYLSKPFDFAELLARVRALIRRDKVHRTRTITIGDLIIETAEHRVSRSGVEITLSNREYELLTALASQEGRVLSREAILNRVWMNDDSYSNTVDVYIGMLRKKIDTGYETKLIHTVRGAGYTIRRGERDTD